MNDRPTPETDAVKFRIEDSNHFAVHVVHARRLERERDEAREELDELNKRLIEVSQLGVDLLIEREDLRKEVAAERALADRLANAVACLSAETTQGYEHIQSAFDAWKEFRK